MSLLRLLTAGRSLVGLKKTEVRYHLPVEKALPKFGSKKNPFRATALPEKPAEPAESANQARENPTDRDGVTSQQNCAPPKTGKEVARVEEGSDQKDSAKLPQERVMMGEAPRDTLDAAQTRRGSAVKAFLLWGRARKGKVGGLSAARPLVQGELSLDRVKVVRNDLSESDLEIVRASRLAVPKESGSGPAAAMAPKAVNVLPGWGAASRLLGLGKS